MAKLIKEILPPLLFRELRRLKKDKYGWLGQYANWDEAKKDSGGYDSSLILEKVDSAVQKVVSGEAVFERDSVLFDKPEYNRPLIGALMYAAANRGGKLELIDFGGSLGSTYYQNRPFFKKLKSVRWTVIEQAHFVARGREKFSHEALRFHETIESAMAESPADVLLLSSVLQYIERPYELLEHLLGFGFGTIIVDRMPFNTRSENRICVQRVSPAIYSASYPCHLLNQEEFMLFFQNNGYCLIDEFDALDGQTKTYKFKGFIFEK